MQEPILEFKNVIFRYPETKKAVLNIDRFILGRGERVFLRGPSGSGKSTFLGLASGVLSPSSGEIKLQNSGFSAQSAIERDRLRADHMGYIFQLFNLIPYLNAEENVLLSLTFSPRKRKELERKELRPEVEAQRLLRALGLDADLSKRPARALSVGQQQRVAAARALIGSPELLLADEATSALDDETSASLMQLMLAECARSQTAVIFVSHNQTLAAHFDRTLDLRHWNPNP